jgi:hypothetical protein
MKKSAFFLAFLLLTAVPAFAQYQQFGVLLGGSKRLFSDKDREDQPNIPNDNFKLSNSVKEAWYGVELEPGTMFKIKVGEIEGPVGVVEDIRRKDDNGNPLPNAIPTSPVKGKYQHIDGIIDYSFSEPYGHTGIFAGVGLYRSSAPGQQSDTDYGFSGGVNGDFPITRRFGFIAEATYHWVNFSYRPRFVTITGGLRISF